MLYLNDDFLDATALDLLSLLTYHNHHTAIYRILKIGFGSCVYWKRLPRHSSLVRLIPFFSPGVIPAIANLPVNWITKASVWEIGTSCVNNTCRLCGRCSAGINTGRESLQDLGCAFRTPLCFPIVLNSKYPVTWSGAAKCEVVHNPWQPLLILVPIITYIHNWILYNLAILILIFMFCV